MAAAARGVAVAASVGSGGSSFASVQLCYMPTEPESDDLAWRGVSALMHNLLGMGRSW